MENHSQYNKERQRQSEDFISTPRLLRTDKDLNVKDFFSVDDTDLYMGKGQIFNRTAVSGAFYSIATTDYLIGITSLAIAPAVGLPRPKLVGSGKTFRIKDEFGGAATTAIGIYSQGEETIDGVSTVAITTNFGAKGVYTDGANWFTY